jgi:hypothetical protein
LEINILLAKRLKLIEKYELKTYDSFEKAVLGPKERNVLAKNDNKKIMGSTIITYFYNGYELALIFSNKKVLLIDLSEKCVCWKIIDQASFDFSKYPLPDYFVLEYPMGATCEWKWKEILDKMIGKSFKAIAPSDVFIWLYVEGCDDLMFNGYLISEEKRELLHFDRD